MYAGWKKNDILGPFVVHHLQIIRLEMQSVSAVCACEVAASSAVFGDWVV